MSHAISDIFHFIFPVVLVFLPFNKVDTKYLTHPLKAVTSFKGVNVSVYFKNVILCCKHVPKLKTETLLKKCLYSRIRISSYSNFILLKGAENFFYSNDSKFE